MNAEKVDFRGLADEGVAWTLVGTLYLRAWESRLPAPILGDHYAAEAIERIDYDMESPPHLHGTHALLYALPQDPGTALPRPLPAHPCPAGAAEHGHGIPVHVLSACLPR